MEVKKRIRTDASRKADMKYNEKRLNFGVGYTPTDILEGLRFKSFLESNNYSANSYIKELIKKDLDAKKVPYPEPQKTE